MNTVLTTYPGNWFNAMWNLPQIWQDQRWCWSTQFYDGWDFTDFANTYSNEETMFVDCASQDHLAVAGVNTCTPDHPSIRTALSTFYPPIQARVNQYYNTIKQGTLDYYQYAIDQNRLDECGFSVEPKLNMTDADQIVQYAIQFFQNNP